MEFNSACNRRWLCIVKLRLLAPPILGAGLAVFAMTEDVSAVEGPGPVGQALLIGVEQYDNFLPLNPIVEHDLRLVRQTLLRVGYDPDAVHGLTNAAGLAQEDWADVHANFGRDEIQDAIAELSPGYGVTLVYFSGHGATYKSRRHLAMQGSSLERGNSYLSVRQLTQDLFDAIGENNAVVVIDACSNSDLKSGDDAPIDDGWQVNHIFSSRVSQSSRILDQELIWLSDDANSGSRHGVSLFTKLFADSLLAPRPSTDDVLTVEGVFLDLEERMSQHWAEHSSVPRVTSCSKVTFLGQQVTTKDPFGGSHAPEQCPDRRIVGGSGSMLARRAPGGCDQLDRASGETLEQAIARQRECVARGRRQ